MIIFLRLAAVCALVLGIMSPFWSGRKILKNPHLFIGIDNTLSINRDKCLQTIQDFQPIFNEWENNKLNHLVTYFLMDENSYPAQSLDSLRLFDDKTWLEKEKSALYQSVEKIKTGLNPSEFPVFLLLTDGNETESNPAFLNQWTQEKILIYFLETNKSDSFYIQNIRLPESAFTENDYRLELITYAEQFGIAEFIIKQNEQEIKREQKELKSGINYFDWLFHSEKAGIQKYEVEVLPSFPDSNLANNRRQAQIKMMLQETMLIIDNKDEMESPALYQMLKDNGFKYHQKKNLHNNEFLTELDSYSAVIVNNISKEELISSFEDDIKLYVFNGGGLAVLGGEKSFGLGGWHRSKLEEILPVNTPPRSYRQNTAVLFIIDVSGSMLCEDPAIYTNQILLGQFLRHAKPEQMPIEAAKNAVVKMLSELNNIDSAVIEFNHVAKLTTPLQTINKNTLPSMIQAVESIRAGGGTNFYPPISGAIDILANYGYQEIHFVFLSDGLPSDKALMPKTLPRLKKANIRLHALAFGSSADSSLLESMAKETGGGFFLSQNMEELSQSFSEAIDGVFGPPVVLTEKKIFLQPGQGLIPSSNKNDDKLPSLLGYVQTELKEEADAILTSESSEPILAIWRYGLGHSSVWTSDISGHWSKNWIQHPWWQKAIISSLNYISKKNFDPYDLKLHIHGNQVYFLLNAINENGSFLNDLQIEANIISDKNFNSIPVFFNQNAEGEYVANISMREPGNYEVILNFKNDTSPTGQKKAYFQVPLGIEGSFATTNQKLKEYFETQNPKNIIYTKTDLERMKEFMKPIEQTETTSFVVILYALAIFLFCLDVIFRRFRVFEQIEAESLTNHHTPELKWLKLGDYYWTLAQKALKQNEMKNAEGYYLSAHKYFKKAGNKEKTNALWQEYRIKIR